MSKLHQLYIIVAPWILLALIVGLLTGLLQIGWDIPVQNINGTHGLLMVGGFIGTVITLEKTLPVYERRWYIVFPVISGLSVLFIIIGIYKAALYFQLLAGLGLVVTYFWWLKQTREPYYRIMMMGALCWIIASAGLLAGRPLPLVLHWWMAFIIFTMVGERLELTNFLPVKNFNMSLLYLFLFMFLAGIFMPYPDYGKIVLGSSLIFISLWLLIFDIIKTSIKKAGQYRYLAILLLVGYVWLFLSGVLIITGSVLPNQYDMIVHSFFLGYTFSMIFAHGPIILPGFTKKNLNIFSPSLYVWVVLFHLSLILRMGADMAQHAEIRKAAGLANAVIILIFFANIIFNTRKALTQQTNLYVENKRS